MQFKFKVRKYVHTFELDELRALFEMDGLYNWFYNKGKSFKYGPAVIYLNGTQEYWLNGKLHREDGPAVIWSNGAQEYWLNGRIHREDGPAVICDGYQFYYLNNQSLTKESWEKKINAI